MSKKLTFLTTILLLILFQFTHTPSAYAMLSPAIKSAKKHTSTIKKQRPALTTRYRINLQKKYTYSTESFSPQDIREEFKQLNGRNIDKFLSTKRFDLLGDELRENLVELNKKTGFYQRKIRDLKDEKEQFNIHRISKLEQTLSLSYPVQESNSDLENEAKEKLDPAILNSLDERYKKLQQDVNTFIEKTNKFIKPNKFVLETTPRINKDTEDLLESINQHAQTIKKELSKSDPCSRKTQKHITDLYAQKNLLRTTCSYSEELEKLNIQINNWADLCNEFEAILKNISKSYDLNPHVYEDIRNYVEQLNTKGKDFRDLHSTNQRIESDAMDLERWLKGCRANINDALKDLNSVSLNTKKYDTQKIIEDSVSNIRNEYSALEESITALKLSTSGFANTIKASLATNKPINNLLSYNINEITTIQKSLENQNNFNLESGSGAESINIEQSIKNIKTENLRILNQQTEVLSVATQFIQRIEDIKQVVSKAQLFIDAQENTIRTNIHRLIEDELRDIHEKIKHKEKTINISSASLETLQKQWSKIVAEGGILTTSSANMEEDHHYDVAGIKTIRILSIDGGGVRGIIPALILKEIEEKTGKPIANQFDVMAGTSIGGILTLALNVPNHQTNENEGLKNKASDIAEMMKTDAQVIFPKKYFPRLRSFLYVVNYLSSKLWTYFKFTSKYLEGKKGLHSTKGLEEVCKKYLGNELFKSSFSTVLIPTTRDKKTDDKNDSLYLFNSKEDIRPYSMKDVAATSMKDVAIATAAAPFFFPKKKIKDFPDDFIDGGVVLNNPAREVYQKTRNEIFAGDKEKVRFLIVSLGTGKTESNLDRFLKILHIMGDSASDAVHRNLGHDFNHDKTLGIYKRINVFLDRKIELNDSRTHTLNYLEEKTKEYLKTKEGEKDIEAIVSLLKQKRPYTTPGKSIIEPNTFQAQRPVNGNSSQKEDL